MGRVGLGNASRRRPRCPKTGRVLVEFRSRAGLAPRPPGSPRHGLGQPPPECTIPPQPHHSSPADRPCERLGLGRFPGHSDPDVHSRGESPGVPRRRARSGRAPAGVRAGGNQVKGQGGQALGEHEHRTCHSLAFEGNRRFNCDRGNGLCYCTRAFLRGGLAPVLTSKWSRLCRDRRLDGPATMGCVRARWVVGVGISSI